MESVGLKARVLRNRALIFALAPLFALGCKTRSGVSSSDITSGSDPVPGTINVDYIYPAAAGQSWTRVEENSRIYIIGLSVVASGTCSLGMDKIHVNEGSGDYSEQASCDSDGAWTWSKTYLGAEEGDKNLTFTGYSIDGVAMTGASQTLQVRVDNTAPVPPTVTTPASTPYNYNGTVNTYTFAGTVSADTVKITVGADTVTPVNNNWTYDVTLVQSASTDFTFYAWDRAGNRSTGTTNTIQWNPTASILAWGPHLGLTASDTLGTGMMLEAAVEPARARGWDATVNPPNANVSFWSGFNELINKLRAD